MKPAPAIEGFCDCHLHVFGDAARYPMDPRRSYTPASAALAQYRAVMVACGIERAVLVQPQALDLVQLFAAWMSDLATRQKIAVANPARLHGF
jgi:predicted TIM-barrel fold metal-dependent hydrolase